MNLTNRLGRLERMLGGRPCIACANLPLVVRIASDADQATHQAQMRQHRLSCTCGRPVRMKRIILRRTAN